MYYFLHRHPLFPLLALLFERCEQATQSAESASSESFNIDIQAFVQHQERDQKPFLINDAEVDGLVSNKNCSLLALFFSSIFASFCIVTLTYFTYFKLGQC